MDPVGRQAGDDTLEQTAGKVQISPRAGSRPTVRGKFFYLGDHKLYLRGVTYGTFRPAADGSEFQPEAVAQDLAKMASYGLNAVRTYTVPPYWMLDLARHFGLWILVGLPWEEHVAFLDEKGLARDIEARVRAGVRACRAHPAVLGYAVGNEIPAAIVRWSGHHRIERFLAQLCRAVKDEDPDGLVTYVNFPSTEYLRLPFLDFAAFNVYLEDSERYAAYLARLHNVVGDRPLVLAEIGLDSLRHGEQAQAHHLARQTRLAFEGGGAGTFVFAWTDEWHRGGTDIDDWRFGLTDRERRPKPALDAVRRSYAAVPFAPDESWPRISVVVCSYNGSRTIRDCLEGLHRVNYPDFEVIVVDDGSTDTTASIAAEYDVRLIRTANHGLSHARNVGLAAATGEVVAYLDDDAWPDPDWLSYLAATLRTTEYVGVGGPNLPPPDDGPIADCVANAPGGPVHVLLSDREAEHIPGCNMAFRTSALREIGGFDPRFRVAGDDVDVCWRLQERGGKLGFHPGAIVWHRRRNSVRAYWKQQVGYGRAEAILERKWPEKYNLVGHQAWSGRLYGNGLIRALGARSSRIYHGTWGAAPFQSRHDAPPGLFSSLLIMPEWYLVAGVLLLTGILGIWWPPLLGALALGALATAAPLAQAVMSARGAQVSGRYRSSTEIRRLRMLTTFLYLLQPLARLVGRFSNGLTPWRSRLDRRALPRPHCRMIWTERWQSVSDRLRAIETHLRRTGAGIRRGGAFDSWDLEIRGGLFGAVRFCLTVEEHGSGYQVVRWRCWPRSSVAGVVAPLGAAVPAIGAALIPAWGVAALFGLLAIALAGWVVHECASATAAALAALPDDPAQSKSKSLTAKGLRTRDKQNSDQAA